MPGRDIASYRRAAEFLNMNNFSLACVQHEYGLFGGPAGSLARLCEVQQSDEGHFVPIGSNGFWKRGETRARFDQQPLEAHSTVSACLEAYRNTGEAKWRTEAQRAFDWFLGRNDLHMPLYDPTTGGCRDGLHPDRPNENQGAESTLAFLTSLVEMRLAENMIME